MTQAPIDLSQSARPDAAVSDISAFMQECTFEATRPSATEVDGLRANLTQGTRVYLTMLPNRPVEELIASAESIRAAGLRPVPHLSARHFVSIQELAKSLRQLRERAAVDNVLLIGGDTTKPAGSVHNVLDVIESGVLQDEGLNATGVAGFPDGHPAVTDEELEAILVTKLAALQNANIEGYIVTQFCFHAHLILKYVSWLRERGLHCPVRIGLAGPTSLMTWLNFARKCGVKASAEALATRSGLVKHAFKAVAPDPIIRSLAAAHSAGQLANATPHLFAFGGIVTTAKWAQPAIKGLIRLNLDGGFDPV